MPRFPLADPTTIASRSLLKKTAVAPTAAPAELTESQKFDHYEQIILDHGGTVSAQPGKKTLCGIRVPTDRSKRLGVYDDTLAMLWTDASGKRHVREYVFNTESTPGFTSGDLGRLKTGTYQYRMAPPGTSMYGNALHPVSGSGTITPNGGVFAFHSGADGATLSAGCQTQPPNDMDRFWKDLQVDTREQLVSYTLVLGRAP